MAKEINTVAIIGAGAQGIQIAFRSAVYGKNVSVYDGNEKTISKADEKVKGWLSDHAERGELEKTESEAAYKRINTEVKGFSHSRVWRAIKKEALRSWSQGYCDYEDLDRAFMLEFSTTFGPFGLMDIVGLDVIRDIELSYFSESGDPSDKPPQKLIELIEAGKLGVKSGEGFYKYPNPAYNNKDWLYKR